MRRKIALILSFILILCASNFSVYAGSADRIQISLTENEDVVSGNPGKGWVRYSAISTGLSDEVLNLVSTGYARFSWYEIEPNEGEYNWFLIDSALESWASVGKKFAFGIMSANTATTEEYVTPKWVFDPYVYVNGRTYIKEMQNGKAFLPVRSCFERIGAKVGWSEETGVFVKFEGNTLYIKDGGVYLNDSQTSIGSGYVNSNGVSYIEIDSFHKIEDFVYEIDTKTGRSTINTVKYELAQANGNDNAISDGDFEEHSNAWSFNYSDFEYCEEKAFSGKTALKVNNNRKSASAYQTFSTQAGKEYKIDFAINDSASVEYVISDGEDVVLYSGIVPKGEGEWKEYSFKFGYDYNALNGSNVTTKIAFVSQQDDSECAYVDGVSLDIIGDIEDVQNGLFSDNGIETNRTKWQGRNGAVFARTGENPYSGELCGVIKNRAGTWYGGMIDIYDTLQENGPGKYKFEGWFRTAPGDGEMGITVYSFKLNNAIDITEVFKINEEWTYLTFESEITQEQYDTLYSAYTLIMGDPNDGENNITKDIYFDDIYMTKVNE